MIAYAVAAVILTVSAVKGQNVCNIGEMLGNIKYRYHDNKCDEYIQCHNDTAGNLYAVYMACPFGQHWSQSSKTCVDITPFSCSLGSCAQPSYRLEGGGCRAYTLCPDIDRQTHNCCLPGERYMGGQCVRDHTCTDPCPGECTTADICRSYPHWSNPTFYYHYHVEEDKVLERICPRGSHFDMLQCGCVAPRRRSCFAQSVLRFATSGTYSGTGIWRANPQLTLTGGEASFENSNILTGNVALGQATQESPLVIRLGFRRATPFDQLQTLFLSNDCKRCNQLRISVRADQFIVTISKENQDVAQISLLTEGFDNSRLIDVAVVYNGRELLAAIRSGTFHSMKRTQAPRLSLMDCGMQISDASSPFRGQLQYVGLYTCHQGGRVQSLFNLPTIPTQ